MAAHTVDEAPAIGRISAGAAMMSIVIGATVLLGWATNNQALISIQPRFIAMLPNTAVVVIVGGITILMLRGEPTLRALALARAGAAFVLTIAVLSLVSRQLGHAVGFIDLLFRDRVAAHPYRPVGVMATNSGFTCVLIGMALFLAPSPRAELRRLSRILSTVGLALVGVALLGHAYGAPALFALDRAAGMALLTALGLGGLLVGTLFLRPRDPGISLVTGSDLAATLMRRLIPLTVIVPVLLGGLSIVGREHAWFSRETGIALFIVLNVGWIAALMLRAASVIRAADRERNQLLDRERSAREAAEAANRAKSDFLAMMSHELRTPLNAIVGYVALLQDSVAGPITPTQEQNLRRIRDNARHLTNVVDEVLSLARIESGKDEVILEPVDVSALLREVAGMIEPLASAKGLSFSCESQPVMIESDAQRLRQILVNLAGNAVKFTPSGSVSLRAFRDDGRVIVEVADTGVGVAPQYLENIFDEFWQVERPHTRQHGGSGLGLAVSRKLARRLGGDISVTSAVGKGSTFRLTIPLNG